MKLTLTDEAWDQRIRRLPTEMHLGGGIRASFAVTHKLGFSGKIEVRRPVNRDGGAALLSPVVLNEQVVEDIHATLARG